MQNRKKAPNGMYTAKEAIAILGIPISSFYNLVRAETIKGVILPGRKEAVYPKAEIERYARSLRLHIEQFNPKKTYFGLALREDIPDIRELVASASSGYSHTVPQDVMEAWIRKNPEALHILRRGTEIIGYVSMFPLPLETIMKRMSGEYWNRTIPIDDIQPFLPSPEPKRLYIAEAVVKQGVPHSKQLGARLIGEIKRYLLELVKQRIIFEEIYAVGTSSFGIRICRNLGMQPLDIPEGAREDRVPFKLDIAHLDLPMLQSYKQALATWKERH